MDVYFLLTLFSPRDEYVFDTLRWVQQWFLHLWSLFYAPDHFMAVMLYNTFMMNMDPKKESSIPVFLVAQFLFYLYSFMCAQPHWVFVGTVSLDVACAYLMIMWAGLVKVTRGAISIHETNNLIFSIRFSPSLQDAGFSDEENEEEDEPEEEKISASYALWSKCRFFTQETECPHDCPICLEKHIDCWVSLPCKHFFHVDCLLKSIVDLQTVKCPCCRAIL